MECQFCNEIMQQGYIKSYKEAIIFTPDEAKFSNFFTGKDNIVLLKPSLFHPAAIIAYYCVKCSRCIIDNVECNI